MVKVPPAPQHPLPDADIHYAICAISFDLGMKVNEQFGKIEPKIMLAWELEQRMEDGRPFMLSREYTLSLHKKSNLRKLIEAWRGKAMTEAEAEDFDTDVLVGKTCRISVVHNKSEHTGKTYANVQAVMPPGAKCPALKVEAKDVPEWFETKRAEYAADVARKLRGEPPPSDHDAEAAGGSLDEVPFAPFDAPF